MYACALAQAEALHHYGVAAASCAQVKGLRMMDRSAAASLPSAAEIFKAGEVALLQAIAIRKGMGAGAADLLLAESIAARAELYYCAASANQSGAVSVAVACAISLGNILMIAAQRNSFVASAPAVCPCRLPLPPAPAYTRSCLCMLVYACVCLCALAWSFCFAAGGI